MTSIKGKIHSIESFGSVDGPGIRFLIFLKGCAMRCRYCHNPDTWSGTIHPDRSDGSTISERLTTADELLDRAERYRTYWGNEGGITVSGGEALLQIDFLIDLFYKAKVRNINTCLDTSAQPFTRKGPWFEKFERLMSLTDTVLLDIKHFDDDKHEWLTGHSNINILDCAKYLSDIQKPVWLRHVLVPGVTDDKENLQQMNAFLRTLRNIERIEVLPYHTLGVFKWEQLGLPYTLEGVPTPTRQQVAEAEKILKDGIQLIK